MFCIHDWMSEKFNWIAERLPLLVETDPASFKCGYSVGYKQCLLDIDKLIENDSITEKHKLCISSSKKCKSSN